MVKQLIPLCLLIALSGCSFFAALVGHTKSERKKDVLPPTNDYSYVWLAGGFIVGAAVGVALAIALPGDDHVPYGIVGGCLFGLVMCLVINTIRTMLVWGLGIALVVGVVWLVRRLYKRWGIEKLVKETT